jgi:hypothetical protein
MITDAVVYRIATRPLVCAVWDPIASWYFFVCVPYLTHKRTRIQHTRLKLCHCPVRFILISTQNSHERSRVVYRPD